VDIVEPGIWVTVLVPTSRRGWSGAVLKGSHGWSIPRCWRHYDYRTPTWRATRSASTDSGATRLCRGALVSAGPDSRARGRIHWSGAHAHLRSRGGLADEEAASCAVAIRA